MTDIPTFTTYLRNEEVSPPAIPLTKTVFLSSVLDVHRAVSPFITRAAAAGLLRGIANIHVHQLRSTRELLPGKIPGRTRQATLAFYARIRLRCLRQS